MTALVTTASTRLRFQRLDAPRQVRHLDAQRGQLAYGFCCRRLAARHPPKMIVREAQSTRDASQHVRRSSLRNASLDLAQRRNRDLRECSQLLLTDRALRHPLVDDLCDIFPVIHAGTSAPRLTCNDFATTTRIVEHAHIDSTSIYSAIDSAISSAYSGATSSFRNRKPNHQRGTNPLEGHLDPHRSARTALDLSGLRSHQPEHHEHLPDVRLAAHPEVWPPTPALQPPAGFGGPASRTKPIRKGDLKVTATTDPDARKAFIDSLRQLARFLASHPTAPVPKWGTSINLTTHGTDEEDRREVDKFAAVMGAKVSDEWDKTGHYSATRVFGVIGYEITGISDAHMAEYRARQAYANQASLDELGTFGEFGEAA